MPEENHGLAPLPDWMRQHLDEPLTVEDLAARTVLSPRTFARRFKETTGTTPHRWLLDQRLQHAEQLLESTGLPVDAVAARAAAPARTPTGGRSQGSRAPPPAR